MRALTLLFLLFCSFPLLKAQQNVVVAGGNGSSTNGYISYSVGQVDFVGLSNTSNAGVQQSFDNSISLPVTGLVLTATKKNKEVQLNWETVAEYNSSYFIVQRSTTGSANFDSIGTVAAAGNSNALLKYSLLDRSPAQGMNYYRLKQVDKDGKFMYSSVVAVNFSSGIAISCYPNPTSSTIQVDIGTNSSNGYSYQLYDMNGKLLQTTLIKQRVTVINLENLKAASYTLKIIDKQLEVGSIIILKR